MKKYYFYAGVLLSIALFICNISLDRENIKLKRQIDVMSATITLQDANLELNRFTLCNKNNEIDELESDIYQLQSKLKEQEELEDSLRIALGNYCEEVRAYEQNSKEIPNSEYSRRDVEDLVRVVQAEAGIDNHKSQKMITKVILNRVKSNGFPDNIHDVLYEKHGNIPQFSTVYNGSMDKQDLDYSTIANVYSVLLFDYDLPEDVLFFYSDSVEENWVNKLNVYDRVQGTVFAYK